MRTLLLALLIPVAAVGQTIDKAEAKKAFEYLNRVRKDPGKFSKEIGVDLSEAKARDELKWNDVLAKAAEAKAKDMAARNYFGHVDPDGFGMNSRVREAGYELPDLYSKEKAANNLESISAGKKTGVEAIRQLIVDKNTPSLGHRIHLLSMDKFDEPNTDIGIGFARAPKGAKYVTYVSVLIARPAK